MDKRKNEDATLETIQTDKHNITCYLGKRQRHFPPTRYSEIIRKKLQASMLTETGLQGQGNSAGDDEPAKILL